MKINNEEITKRIKKLIADNKVSEYYVWTKTDIPSASFSVMINNKSLWKLQQLVDIANLFNVSFQSLVFGESTNKETKRILREMKILKEINEKQVEELKKYSKLKLKLTDIVLELKKE